MVLDLGETPLANRLLEPSQLGEPEPRFPLRLAFCPACALVQITATVPPEVLFRHYVYFSSFSDTLVEHARELACQVIRTRALGRGSLVVEIASNDGYLLRHYREAGIPVLGIEPAANVAEVARRERGIDTLNEFFGESLGVRLRDEGTSADVVHAHNVLAHVGDPNGFFAGLGALLKPGGVAIVEVPYVKDMIDGVEFDTIYHEHLSYFSLTSVNRLAGRHGLLIQNVERVAIHGGSLRVFIEHARSGRRAADAVERLLAEEKSWGVDDVAFYKQFGAKVARLKVGLLGLLREMKSRGDRIAAYGASAKGATLLNHFGIDGRTLDFVVDRSTAKQGFYTPGTHLPIYAPEKLLEAMPQHALLLTWNFAGEILAQQSEYRRRGGDFIIPIPEPRIVGRLAP